MILGLLKVRLYSEPSQTWSEIELVNHIIHFHEKLRLSNYSSKKVSLNYWIGPEVSFGQVNANDVTMVKINFMLSFNILLLPQMGL